MSWIGIDIAKQDFVAAQRSDAGFETECFPMTQTGFEAFQRWLPQGSKLGIVFEATGPYWLPLARWLDALEHARAEIDQEVTRAREDLRGKVVSIALAGAGKVLEREVDESAHDELMNKLAAEI